MTRGYDLWASEREAAETLPCGLRVQTKDEPPIARIWHPRASKPAVHTRFRSTHRRDEYVAEYVDRYTEREALKAAERAAAKAARIAAKATIRAAAKLSPAAARGAEVLSILTAESGRASYDGGPRYISVAGTAKLLRLALADEFPGTRFRVVSDSYAGGASIDVRWQDGPAFAAVDAVLQRYAGGGFDGMIDMAYSSTHWLLPNGRAVFAHTSGTEGSMGTVPAADGPAEVGEIPGAVRVRFGADYVFGYQEFTAERAAEITARADSMDRYRAQMRYNPPHRADDPIADVQFAYMVSRSPRDFPATAWRAGWLTAAEAAAAAGFDVEEGRA